MIKFTVHIKEIKVSLDAVGDKVGRIVLKFWPLEHDDLVDCLNSLQAPDKNVIVEMDNEKTQA